MLALVPECVAISFVVALIWLGIWTTLLDQHRNAASGAERDTSNLARAFEENTERIFASVDQTLLSFRDDFQREGRSLDLHAWMATNTTPDPYTSQIAVADVNGMVFASTVAGPPVSIADRPAFPSCSGCPPMTGCSSASRYWDGSAAVGRSSSPAS